MPAPKRTGKVAGLKALTATTTPDGDDERVSVTYRGPTDPKDGTTRVLADGERFALDQQVETTRTTAERLAAMAGHTFHIEPARPEGGM